MEVVAIAAMIMLFTDQLGKREIQKDRVHCGRHFDMADAGVGDYSRIHDKQDMRSVELSAKEKWKNFEK